MMADCNCSTTEFIGVDRNAFYFYGYPEDETDRCIEEDTFKFRETQVKFLQCHDNKYLILSWNDSHQFEKKDLTVGELKKPGEKQFHLRFYNDVSTNVGVSKQDRPKGIPVMLYAIQSGQHLVVSCKDNGDIYPEPMEYKDTIDGLGDKALFYMVSKQDGSNKYMFKSSLDEKKWLGFTQDESNPSVVKLRLQKYDPDNHQNAFSLQPSMKE